MAQTIKEGWLVFVSDGDSGIGSVRRVLPGGRPELVVYVENAGDFVVPLEAIESIHADKVILDRARLAPGLRTAIEHARDAEDGSFVEHAVAEVEGGDILSPEFIAQQRRRLEALRAEILGLPEAGQFPAAPAAQGEQEEEAHEFEENAQYVARSEVRRTLHDMDRRRLAHIDRALRKIEEGSYGFSDLSGERIPRARLEIAPEAVLTVEEERQREGRP